MLAAAATVAVVFARGCCSATAPRAAVRRPAPPAADELVVSFLDIGQGDATLIQLGATLGARRHRASRRTDPRSAWGRRGSKRLDALVLTHAEADHEGAAPAVIRAPLPAARRRRRRGLELDGAARAADRARRRSRTAAHAHGGPGDHGRRPALRGAVAAGATAGGAPDGNPNDRAVVARLEAGTFSMLLSADAESNITGALALEPVDVLKVAHHGSADPGLPALLDAPAAEGRCDRGRPRQHATGTRRRRRSRPSSRRCRRSCGPTATAPRACIPSATACGWSHESAYRPRGQRPEGARWGGARRTG